jgi:hypothetical protein|tara:strand:+ start:417 stop:602 length:186 start_codon:yes stop_codon:yes gene_type:complete
MKKVVQYMTIDEMHLAFDLLCESKPEIINDAQNFTEVLVGLAERTGRVVNFNDVRVAMRSL